MRDQSGPGDLARVLDHGLGGAHLVAHEPVHLPGAVLEQLTHIGDLATRPPVIAPRR